MQARYLAQPGTTSLSAASQQLLLVPRPSLSFRCLLEASGVQVCLSGVCHSRQLHPCLFLCHRVRRHSKASSTLGPKAKDPSKGSSFASRE